MYPGLASWAKFSRPSGLSLEMEFHTHALQPLLGHILPEILCLERILGPKGAGLKAPEVRVSDPLS
jgi:hypothetical protein